MTINIYATPANNYEGIKQIKDNIKTTYKTNPNKAISDVQKHKLIKSMQFTINVK